MKSTWFRVMIPLLLLMLVTAQALASAADGVTVAIPFTVELASGTVVMEALDGAPAPATAEFAGVAEGTFEVTILKPGNYHYRIFQEDGADATVEYDQTVFHAELFVTVDENGVLSASVTVSLDSSAHKPDSIGFVNVQKRGGLRITKTVTGDAGDTNRKWHFTITLSDKTDKLYSDVWFDTGVAHVTLKHGETVTVEGIPMGTEYSVTEDEADADGYTTTFTGATGVIGEDTVVEVAFVNEKGEVPDEPEDEPTDEPADEPTDEPGDEPEGEPTDEPAGEPTDEPGDEPTDEPTDEPAGGPTEEPTTQPTTTPEGDTPTSNPEDGSTATTSPSTSTPKTGDDSILNVWIGLAVFSLAGIVVILLLGRKRRSTDRSDT